MSSENSVKMNESIILLRHDVLNLLDHVNKPQVETAGWWKELDNRLAIVELWSRMMRSEEVEADGKS